MSAPFDVIIIGSGFGGAVTSCRLAEKGMNVLILERGRRWDPEDYPNEPDDDWVYDVKEPHMQNGWLDLRTFDDMMVAMGAGVGGGSLIYANVSLIPPKRTFDEGWPPEITFEGLEPYYEEVGRMLNLQKIPRNQLTKRYKLTQEAAEKLGYTDRFDSVPLTVTFDPEWSYDLDDPFNEKHSKTWINDQGKEQGTCVHLGNCDIGCPVKAKNTLDFNYIALAEQYGAEVRPLHFVKYIEPEDGSYRVHFDRLQERQRFQGSEVAPRVILAAGSIGSTEILLRSRDQYKALPDLSHFLGHNWSSNGDFLTPAIHKDREISSTQGPTITSAVDFLDGEEVEQRFILEDGGFPDILGNYLEEKVDQGIKRFRNRKFKVLLEAVGEVMRMRDPLNHVMPWFANGVDAANGRLYLGRYWYAPCKRKLKLDWEIDRSEELIESIIQMHKRFAEATGGDIWVSPTWSVLKNLITPHPLGGCNIGTSPENGVVNHRGEVFGYPNLYVADGAIVPKAIGLNPSRTIAALAERIAHLMEK